MLSLLHRDPFSKSEDPDDQATAYSGKSLPLGSVYYSKAGWNGAEYTLAIFTDDSSKRAEIIPFVSQRIAQECALVSQFWPDSPPTRRSFPMRNAVMSGMTLGTVIVEASHASGTRIQARLALAAAG